MSRPQCKHQAWIAFGSNLGERLENLKAALNLLVANPQIELHRKSSVYQTAPVGGPGNQNDYFNAVVALETSLDPTHLLRLCLAVEDELGRVRKEVNGPRTIDLDLLLYGDLIIDTVELILPHPRLAERLFVLDPLAEIAPDAIHPLLSRSIIDLRKQLSVKNQQVRPVFRSDWLTQV